MSSILIIMHCTTCTLVYGEIKQLRMVITTNNLLSTLQPVIPEIIDSLFLDIARVDAEVTRASGFPMRTNNNFRITCLLINYYIYL